MGVLTYQSDDYCSKRNMRIKTAHVWHDWGDICIFSLISCTIVFTAHFAGLALVDTFIYDNALTFSYNIKLGLFATGVVGLLWWPVLLFVAYLRLCRQLNKNNNEMFRVNEAHRLRNEREILTRDVDMFVKEVRK